MTIKQTIGAADVAALREAFSGVVLAPEEAGYDDARRVWNAMIDRRPAVILRCADTSDVVRAVRFAREQDLTTTVRGGGHSIAGLAVCDGGVMIDLSTMRGVDVDPAARRAVVQGGATWSDFDGAAQQHGLATTGGHVGSTGVGGLTLGGGFGWLHGKHGLASDNLVSAEVVTAAGEVVRASDSENPELLWGLRGGGGNFGVVTSFEFALHPLTDVFVGGVMYPRDKGAQLMEVYDDLVDKLPHEATSAFTLGTVPEGVALVPPEFQGVESSGAFVIYPGATAEEGERLIEPLRAFGPSFELAQPMPYLGLQTLMDATWQTGKSVYWKSGRVDTLGEGAATAIVEAASDAYACLLIQLGGQIAEHPSDATAFAHRDARYQFLTSAMWEDPAETEMQVARARKAWETVEPYTTGAFVNFVTTDDWNERTDDAYGTEHSRRLAAIKKTYDPDNFFHMNANIKPA